jgi:hypothetical protein
MGFYGQALAQFSYVLEMEFSMQRHIRMHMISTYLNIEDVAKFGCCTWKQAPNQTLTAKRNLVLKGSCGSLKFSTPRKEKRTPLHNQQPKKLVTTSTTN